MTPPRALGPAVFALAVGVSTAVAEAPSQPPDDLDVIKKRLVASLTLSDRPAHVKKTAIKRARALARTLRDDGTWPDVRYNRQLESVRDSVYRHLDRLLFLARAYRLGAQELKEPALKALDHRLAHPEYARGHWHAIMITVPTRTGDAAILLEDALSDAQREGVIRLTNQAMYYGQEGANIAGIACSFLRRAVPADRGMDRRRLAGRGRAAEREPGVLELGLHGSSSARVLPVDPHVTFGPAHHGRPHCTPGRLVAAPVRRHDVPLAVRQRVPRRLRRVGLAAAAGRHGAGRRSADEGVLEHGEVAGQGKCLRRRDIGARSRERVSDAGLAANGAECLNLPPLR